MVSWNFDKHINRKGTNSIKWDFLKERFGNEDLLPLWVADMDFQCPPAVMEAVKKLAEHGVFGYASPRDTYFNAIIGWMKKRFEWDIKKEWIVTVPGIVPAIGLAIETFTKPKEGVIVQQPVYFPFMSVIEEADRLVVNNGLLETQEGYQMDFDGLEALAAKRENTMMILCSPHNPVGRVWTEEELRRVVDICDRNDVLLVSDEIHHDLIHSGYKHVPIAKIAQEKTKLITCTAPSKTFNIAGVYASNIIISDSSIRERFQRTLEKRHLMTSIFAIEALKAAYNDGETWLEALLQYLEGNMDFVEKFIRENLPRIKVRRPESTFLMWLDFRDYNLTNDDLRNKMINEAHLALNNGWQFGQAGNGFMRLNIGCPQATLEKALKAMEKVFK